MYRPSSPQSSMFEVEKYYPDALPETDWSYTYQAKILPLIDEEKFRHLYSESEGRPNAPIKTMVSLLIFMGMEQLTWRGIEFQFPRRLDWLIATTTPLGEAFLDHTTLFKFYQRLEVDNTARTLFTEITDAFVTACGTSLKKQRTDSFFIHGWLQLLSRYGLFKETIRTFLQALRKQKPGLYKNIKGQLSREYLEKKFDLTEKDPDIARTKISVMARDLYRLKCAFEHHHQVKHYKTFQILVTVFSQQCEVQDSDDAAPEIIIKEKPDTPTVCSPHNPEVRYIRKGTQRITGDKGVITETCAPENKTQFIVDADVVEATEHDSKQPSMIQDRLIANGFKPEQQYGDAGFVNGQTILDSRENGIALEGPTAGRSQSFDTYKDNDRPFDAGDFAMTIDENTNQLRITACPTKQAPKKQKRSKKTGKLIAHFDPDICRDCPHARRCPVQIGHRVATFKVSKAEYVGAIRHHQYMGNNEYRKECAIRAGAEAMVSELTRAHTMRKSRHKKRSRTRLQLIFATLACNVKRFIRHGALYGYLQPHLA